LCITEVRLGRQDFRDAIRTGKSPLHDLDVKILAILHKSPFESPRSIAEILRIACLRVLLHFHDSIDLRSFHLGGVWHLLTRNLHEKRNKFAETILPFVHTAERDSRHDLATGNVSFFLEYISESHVDSVER
jgi:hypothetical protein